MTHANTSTNAHASSSSSTHATHPAAGSPRYIDDGYVELVSVIGTGAYGVVYLALDSRYCQLDGSPSLRAVKCMRRYGLDERQRHFQRREIALHRLASGHPSIITMNRLLEEGNWIYMVMDYGDEGDLFAMITDKQRVGLPHTQTVLLSFLCNVAHRLTTSVCRIQRTCPISVFTTRQRCRTPSRSRYRSSRH